MSNSEFGLNIFILCLFCSSLIFLFIFMRKSHEKFFSLSGALYGPKVIPKTDTCLCSQLYGSEETFPKKYVPINNCASCHT